MSEYKLGPRFFSSLRRRLWFTNAVTILFMLAILFWVFRRFEGLPIGFYAAIGLLLLGSGFFTIRSMDRLQERSWSTFRLILNEEGITQVQDTRQTRINYDEITRVNQKAGIGILSTDRFRSILVPPTLEKYDDFCRELAQHHPIDVVTNAKATRNVIVAVVILVAEIILGAVAFILFFAATNDYVVISASVGLLLMAAFSIVMTRKVPIPGLTQGLGAGAFWFCMIFLGLAAIARIMLAIAY